MRCPHKLEGLNLPRLLLELPIGYFQSISVTFTRMKFDRDLPHVIFLQKISTNIGKLSRTGLEHLFAYLKVCKNT